MDGRLGKFFIVRVELISLGEIVVTPQLDKSEFFKNPIEVLIVLLFNEINLQSYEAWNDP